MKTTITRCGFCETCFYNNRPTRKDYFAVKGGKTNKYYVHKVDSPHKAGYVPMIFTLEKSDTKYVYFSQVCSICGCGLELQYDAQDKAYINVLTVTHSKMSIKDWNALVMFKDTGYRLDD